MMMRDKSNHKRHVEMRAYVGTKEQIDEVRKLAHSLFKHYESDKRMVRRAVKVINISTPIPVYDKVMDKDEDMEAIMVFWDWHALYGDEIYSRFKELERN